MKAKPPERRARTRWPSAVIVVVVVVQPTILVACGLDTTMIASIIAANAMVLKLATPRLAPDAA